VNARLKLGVSIVGFVLVLFLIPPMLWPEPDVYAAYPLKANMRDTIPIRVSLKAWHRNIDVGQVRFYVDYTQSTAVGPNGVFYPELIVQRRPRRFKGGGTWPNPFAWPYAKHVDAEVVLSKYVEKGTIGPGELIGKIDVTYSYYSSRGGKYAMDRTRTDTKSVPFRIQIHE